MPLALKGPDTRVILAGDWKQLGPVVCVCSGRAQIPRLEPPTQNPWTPWGEGRGKVLEAILNQTPIRNPSHLNVGAVAACGRAGPG
jgi:hypothetical protein